MRVGTNMSLAAVAEVGEIAAVVEVPVLMG